MSDWAYLMLITVAAAILAGILALPVTMTGPVFAASPDHETAGPEV